MYIEEINSKNRVYKYYFDNLVKAKKLENKKFQLMKKNYEDLVIYFARYVHSKTRKMLSLNYHEFMGKVKINGEKKYLVIDDYVRQSWS